MSNLKLISVNNDYKRNITICKLLKDRHSLTYGKGKQKVNQEKLHDADKTKYQIYDAIKASLPQSTDYKVIASQFDKHGITIQFKYRRGSDIAVGVSFEKEGYKFKGSEIDRRFSHAGLKKMFGALIYLEEKQQKEEQQRAEQRKRKPPTPTVKGVKLTVEQWDTLKSGGYLHLDNLQSNEGKPFSSYIFTDDRQKRIFFSKIQPDTFVKYGHYEMREMDRRLIEAGHVIRATVKWWGNAGQFACPYLWKVNPTDIDYQESWGDPRVSENQPQTPSAPTPTATFTTEPIGKTITDTVQGVAEAVSNVAFIFDLSLANHGINSEEENFRKRMEYQQRKRRGRRI